MEGMPGTFNWEQEKSDRVAVRRNITHHVQTVLESALSHPRASEIEEITLADSHANGDNLDYSITALDERINLISGYPRPFYMMPDLNQDYEQVWLLGYHSGTGSLCGNMDHTYSNSKIQKIWINGKAMSEATINAAYAGYHGIPVALVTGDEALKQDLIVSMPWLEYVATKKALAKFAAKCYSQTKVDALTKQAVLKALSVPGNELPIYTFESPYTLRIEFHGTSMADQATMMPGIKRLDGRTIEYTNSNYSILFEAIMAIVTLAYSTTL
jgi:D-amino peptidase